jgi:hypothetical protein
MVQIVDLPSEVLAEICLWVFLYLESDTPEPSEGDQDAELHNRLELFYQYSNSKILNNSFTADISYVHAVRGGGIDEYYEAFCFVGCLRKNILALSLTCRRLHEIVEPLLWKVVETSEDTGSGGSNSAILRILHTITKRPVLGRYISALAFRHSYVYHPGTTRTFTEDEKREMAATLHCDSTTQIYNIFDRASNLKALKFAIETEPEYFSVFSAPVSNPSGLPLGLQNLTEMSFYWEDPDADAFLAPMLLPLFLLPSLKTLYLGRIAAGTSDPDSDFEDFQQHYGTSTITSLIIDFGLVEQSAIVAYCKLPKRLERFEYSYGGGSNRCSNAELGEYYSALLPQKASLKTLKIRGCRDMRAAEDEEAPDPSILRSFTALQEFACPVRLLIFPEGSGNTTHYKLEDVLPLNIETVTLFMYDDWTVAAMYELVETFLAFGKTKFPNLKEMRVEIWLSVEENALKARRGGVQADWSAAENEIRVRAAKLIKTGQDHEVKLELELDPASQTQSW